MRLSGPSRETGMETRDFPSAWPPFPSGHAPFLRARLYQEKGQPGRSVKCSPWFTRRAGTSALTPFTQVEWPPLSNATGSSPARAGMVTRFHSHGWSYSSAGLSSSWGSLLSRSRGLTALSESESTLWPSGS